MIINVTRNATRRYLPDGSFVEVSIQEIPSDEWRPHGFHYRLAWVQVCEGGLNRLRVLFDNHSGKSDHVHIDSEESPYEFRGVDQLLDDFAEAIRNIGGSV